MKTVAPNVLSHQSRHVRCHSVAVHGLEAADDVTGDEGWGIR